MTLAAGVVVASVARRRRGARRVERVELYALDGSIVSLAAGSLEADRLLTLARDLLVVAR